MSQPPFDQSNDLPEPVIVKDCRPEILPASSQHDLQHFLDFGGGVNPMAYKGYTFSKHGRFQFWQNHHTPTPNSHHQKDKSFKSPSSKSQHQLDPIQPTIPSSKNDINLHQQSSSSCCSFLGPLTPIFPTAPQHQVATSTLLSPTVYITWRFLLFVFSVVALVLIVLEHPESIPTLSGFALLYSFFSNSVMLTETLHYRVGQSNGSDNTNLNRLHGLISTIFQGSSLACLMGIIGSFLVVLYGTSTAAVTAASFFQSVTVYLLTTLVALHLTDICFTPIPFTVLSTLPLHVLLISVFAVSLGGPSLRQVLTGTAIMSVSSLGTGFTIHLLARVIMLAVHSNVIRNIGTMNHLARDTRFNNV